MTSAPTSSQREVSDSVVEPTAWSSNSAIVIVIVIDGSINASNWR
jgi:hypothetical protein